MRLRHTIYDPKPQSGLRRPGIITNDNLQCSYLSESKESKKPIVIKITKEEYWRTKDLNLIQVVIIL